MNAIVVRTLGFLGIILLGYILKQIGFFKKEDSKIISKIIINITLPSVLLLGARTFEFSNITIYLILTAIIANLSLGFIGRRAFKLDSPVNRSTAMINSSGFNVANITIPFVITFYPPAAISYISMFDMGNAPTWLGAIFSFASNESKGQSISFNWRVFVENLKRSMPFITYLFIILMKLTNIILPDSVYSVVEVIGSANTFLVMILIGIMIDFNVNKDQRFSVLKIVGIRLLGFVFFGSIVYFALPLPMMVKEIAVLCLAAPIPSAAPVFARMLNDESTVPAMVNTVSMFVGLLLSFVLLLLFA